MACSGEGGAFFPSQQSLPSAREGHTATRVGPVHRSIDHGDGGPATGRQRDVFPFIEVLGGAGKMVNPTN